MPPDHFWQIFVNFKSHFIGLNYDDGYIFTDELISLFHVFSKLIHICIIKTLWLFYFNRLRYMLSDFKWHFHWYFPTWLQFHTKFYLLRNWGTIMDNFPCNCNYTPNSAFLETVAQSKDIFQCNCSLTPNIVFFRNWRS